MLRKSLAAIVATLVLSTAVHAQVAPAGGPTNTWAPAPAPTGAPVPPVVDPIAPQSAPSPIQPPAPSPVPGRGIPGKSLGLEQKAWLDPTRHMSRRQSRPGFVRYQWRPDEIMQINVREGLVSVIKFPSNEEVVQVISSDPATFEAIISPNKRSFAMRSVYAGVDGNIIAYGSSGNVYNFYIRSLVYNAPVLPDATVEISVGGMAATTGETVTSAAAAIPTSSGYGNLFTPASTRAVAHFDAGGREYARGSAINPDNMRANIIIKAQTPADSAIAPIRAWHDGRFTYLDFGPNASAMVQWPVAALVVQGVESPVGTRVTGKDRSMMIVEAVGNIVLRNGQYIVCLYAQFPGNDTRYAVDPPLEDYRKQPNAGIAYRAPAPVAAREVVDERPTRPVKLRKLVEAAPVVLKTAPVAAAAPAIAVTAVKVGTLTATIGPIAPLAGSRLITSLKKQHGAAVSALTLGWQNDRGISVDPGTTKDRAFMVVDGLDKPLGDSLCSKARATGAGCSFIR